MIEHMHVVDGSGYEPHVSINNTIAANPDPDPIELAEALGGRQAGSLMRRWLSAGGSLHELCEQGAPETWPQVLQERFAAAVALVRAGDRSRPPEAGPYRQPRQLFRYLERKLPLAREHFGVLLFNAKYFITRDVTLYQGTRDGTMVDTGDVIRCALAADAKSLVTWHNHPSGDACPSQADERVWAQIDDAAKLMSIQVDDHLIMTRPNGATYSRRIRDSF